VSRIGSIAVEAKAADRPAAFDLAKYWEESTSRFREQLPEVIATYLINPRILQWIRYKGWRVVDQVVEGERICVRLRFDSEEEVIQLALAHGADIELIEPANLRNVVRDAATATARNYAR
jgi:predicted DNA-binding transcriptional regulator YafY